MHAPAGEVPSGGRRKGVAALLGAAALAVAVASLPLLVLALAVLCILLPRRRWVTAVPALAWIGFSLAQLPTAGPLYSTLVVGTAGLAAAFALLTVLRPGWPVISRALTGLGGALSVVGLWLAASGRWGALDRAAREQMNLLAGTWRERLSARVADPAVEAAAERAVAELVDRMVAVFPAGLALQMLLALVLAWWLFVRLGAREARWPPTGPLREFRFNDQLVWVLVAGLLLLVLPLGPLAVRAGANLLLFMGVLYAVRGIAIFLFMADGRSPLLLVVLGVLAALLVPPVVLIPLLVGLGDTWLDIRRRAALATPA
jgi:hypothetical protein